MVPRMRSGAGLAVAALCFAILNLALSQVGLAAAPAREPGLATVAPESVGWSSAKLEEARAFAEKINSAAVMVLCDGKAFVSWGGVDKKLKLHSIRKPLLSALYGIYWGRGQINLEATLAELGIDDIPPSLTPEERQAKVIDLLKSRSGIYHEAAGESREMAEARPARGSHAPGTFYYYNNWDFNALGVIFEKETGARIFEAFKREIADPIGMEDFALADCDYAHEAGKSLHPAYNFRMSARDLARFGQLYLQNGAWNGRQIIPRGWIEKSTTAYSAVSEQMGVGYGYMWSVVTPGSAFSNMLFEGKGAFFHTGVGIHTLAIVPEQRLVYVYRYDTDGDFQDPGEATMQLVAMIMNARLTKQDGSAAR